MEWRLCVSHFYFSKCTNRLTWAGTGYGTSEKIGETTCLLKFASWSPGKLASCWRHSWAVWGCGTWRDTRSLPHLIMKLFVINANTPFKWPWISGYLSGWRRDSKTCRAELKSLESLRRNRRRLEAQWVWPGRFPNECQSPDPTQSLMNSLCPMPDRGKRRTTIWTLYRLLSKCLAYNKKKSLKLWRARSFHR